MNGSNEKTTTSVLFPLFIVALTLFALMIFQTTQIARDRHALSAAAQQQTAPLEQAQKIDAQVNALAAGTAKLAQKGDKDAQSIVARLKQAGIVLGPQPTQASPGTMPSSGSPAVPSATAPATPPEQ